MVEEILASGKADMVAMTRAQIADPEFAKKVRDGRENELVHCIRGNQGCIGRVFKGLPITCTVNPGSGRERRFGPGTLSLTDQPARWLVAGANVVYLPSNIRADRGTFNPKVAGSSPARPIRRRTAMRKPHGYAGQACRRRRLWAWRGLPVPPRRSPRDRVTSRALGSVLAPA